MVRLNITEDIVFVTTCNAYNEHGYKLTLRSFEKNVDYPLTAYRSELLSFFVFISEMQYVASKNNTKMKYTIFY